MLGVLDLGNPEIEAASVVADRIRDGVEHVSSTGDLEGVAFRNRSWSRRKDAPAANYTASSAPQFGSNPVSSRGFLKTGIFQEDAGDFRQFRTVVRQIGSLETDPRIAKARHWRAFLHSRDQFSSSHMPGWRRSADRTRLHANSLLTGNFTGNFAILGLREPISE